MKLARFWGSNRSALVADFQQFYNMNLLEFAGDLDGEETTDSVLRLAILAANLPDDSRVTRETIPAMRWSDEAYLLASLVDLVNAFRYMFSEDSTKGVNAPEPLPRPAQVAENMARIAATDKAYIDKILGGSYGGSSAE